MRLTYLDPDFCQQPYDATRKRIEDSICKNQSSWFFQANALVSLAKTAYAIGRPLEELRSWLRQAADAYHELFALRGTRFTKRVRYRNGQPLPEETIRSDGYTSVDSFDAAMVALAIKDIALARRLVECAGHSPNAELVSPDSQVCTRNQQKLSHALNALLNSKTELANRESERLDRRATQIELQIARTISAIATNGDPFSERDVLLAYHEKTAKQEDHQLDVDLWLCLPALGLSFLAMHFGEYEPQELQTDSVYCPVALLTDFDTTTDDDAIGLEPP